MRNKAIALLLLCVGIGYNAYAQKMKMSTTIPVGIENANTIESEHLGEVNHLGASPEASFT